MMRFFKSIKKARQKMVNMPNTITEIEQTQQQTDEIITNAEKLLFDGERKWFMESLPGGRFQLICECQLPQKDSS